MEITHVCFFYCYMNINHMLSIIIIIIIIIHLKREPVKDTFAIRDPKGGLWYKVSCPESLAELRVSTYRPGPQYLTGRKR